MADKNAELIDISPNELVTFLTEHADKEWEHRRPYLLSNVTPALKNRGFAYKAAVGDQSLAQWALAVDQDGFRVVRHPKQKAKVGVIPAGETYEFPPDADAVPESPSQTNSGRRVKPIVVRFLESLSRLEAEDLDKIELPVSVIVKLMKD